MLVQHSDGGSIANIPTDVEAVNFIGTQTMETKEHRDFKEFLAPTAQELERLINTSIGECLSIPTDEQNNNFAGLLNQGSCLE